MDRPTGWSKLTPILLRAFHRSWQPTVISNRSMVRLNVVGMSASFGTKMQAPSSEISNIAQSTGTLLPGRYNLPVLSVSSLELLLRSNIRSLPQLARSPLMARTMRLEEMTSTAFFARCATCTNVLCLRSSKERRLSRSGNCSGERRPAAQFAV